MSFFLKDIQLYITKDKHIEMSLLQELHDRNYKNLELIFDAEQSALVEINRSGVCIYANEIAEKFLDLEKNDLIGFNIHQLFHPHVIEAKHSCPLTTALRNGQACRNITEKLNHNGKAKLIQYSVLPIHQNNHIQSLIITFSMQTPQQSYLKNYADTTSEKEKLRFRALIEHSSDGIITTNNESIINFAAENSKQLVGYSPDELYGKSTFSLIYDKDMEYAYSIYEQILQKSGETIKYEIRLSRKDEKIIWVEVTTTNLLEDPDVEAIIHNFHDITERKLTEEKVHKLAYYDILTGLPNRVLFEDRFKHQIAISRRSACPFGLLFVDLDHFKEVNDTLGHKAGDKVLQNVAKRLSQCVRECDTVCRLSGDEFTIIVTDTEEISPIAQRILESITKPFKINKHKVNISPSIGIALFPQDGTTIDEITKSADKAMYWSKTNGKNRYHFYHEIQNHTTSTNLS